MYLKFGIDMRETPILIYPTLHYQNGGLEIGVNGMTGVQNLYVAGEALDVDAVTGGFNLQAAWTTAYVCAESIIERFNQPSTSITPTP